MLRAKHTLAGAILTMLAFPSITRAGEIHVPGDVPTIQIAINFAANGDEIIVAPGTYFETIDLVGKAITVRSAAGPAATTIDALGQFTSAVKIISGEGPGTVLEGFTITRGDASYVFPHDRGGGIYVNLASPTIRDCVLVANSATYGGGLYCNAGAPTITDCEIRNNVAFRGAGLYVGGSNGLVMTDSIIEGNSTTDQGGGMWSSTSSLNVDRCVFRNNTGGSGGGIFFTASGTPTVQNSEFYDNQGIGTGSAVYTAGAMNLTMRHCTVTSNPSGNSIVLYTASGGLTYVENSIFWEPPQVPFGGAGSEAVTYSNVSGGWAGTGNINLSPRFEDLGGRDLRLRIQSPCVDAGDSNPSIGAYPTDLGGLPRAFNVMQKPDTGLAVFGLTVDMGAHELRGGQAAGLVR